VLDSNGHLVYGNTAFQVCTAAAHGGHPEAFPINTPIVVNPTTPGTIVTVGDLPLVAEPTTGAHVTVGGVNICVGSAAFNVTVGPTTPLPMSRDEVAELANTQSYSSNLINMSGIVGLVSLMIIATNPYLDNALYLVYVILISIVIVLKIITIGLVMRMKCLKSGKGRDRLWLQRLTSVVLVFTVADQLLLIGIVAMSSLVTTRAQACAQSNYSGPDCKRL
jgi:hypothetical protein